MALPTHVPGTWNAVLSTTMHNYRKQLTDNIFNSRPLLNYLMSNGRVKTADGGYSIIEPLLLGLGDADSYSQWQTINVNAVQGISAAQYLWKQLYATIIISGLEEAQNNGKEQIVSLIEAKVMQAEESLKTILSQMLYGTRGANAHADTDFTPFTTLIDATAAAGGIDPTSGADVNLWRSTTVDAGTMTGIDSTGAAVAGLPTVGTLDGAELEKLLRRVYTLSSDGGSDKPDAIFCGSGFFEAYEGSLTPQVRYTDTSKANLGFQNLMFKNIPIYYDPDCPPGTALFLNNKYIGLTLHSDRNFKQSPFSSNLGGMDTATTNPRAAGVAPTTPAAPAGFALDARVSFITTYGNTTVRNRRRLAKIINATFV